MILDFIFNTSFSFLNYVVSLLPLMKSLPTDFYNAWDLLSNFISNLYYVVPEVSHILLIASFTLILESSIFLFKLFNWVYNKLRGSG